MKSTFNKFFLTISERCGELYASQRSALDAQWVLIVWILGSSSLLFFSELPDSLIILLVGLLLCMASIQYRCLILVAVFAFSMAWASWHFSNHQQRILMPELQSKSIQLIGRISGLPDKRVARTRFNFRIKHAVAGQGVKSDQLVSFADQLIQLSCYRCALEFLPDQTWLLTVRLKPPHGYASWGAFDFEKYLFRQKIVARGYLRTKEETWLIDSNVQTIDSFRWRVSQQLQQPSKHPSAGRGMIAALMIGDKSLLSRSHKSVFQATGVSHLMAISGLHIGLVFVSVAWLLKWLMMPIARIFEWQPRQRIVLLPALMAAVAYAALAGFAVSTQRAFIMLFIFVICRFCARDVSLFKVLLIAAVAILMFDPFSILDSGFWLSCLAVLLIAFATRSDNQLSLIRLQPILWLGMLPMTLFFFGQASIISPLVNLLLVPVFCLILIPLVLISLLLLQVGLVGLHSMILDLLNIVFNWVYYCLETLQQLPLASISPSPLVLVQLISTGVIGLLIWKNPHNRLKLSMVCVLLVFATPVSLQEDGVRVAVLDVGQGLSVVIETKNTVLVFDTGAAYAGGFSATEAVLLPYLRRRGIQKIDTLIVSHADNDHAGGFRVLTNNVQVKHVLASNLEQIESVPSVSKYEVCHAGQMWSSGGVVFSVLSPGSGSPQGGNNRSCVLRIDNGTYSVLLTADIELATERWLVTSQASTSADFLLVPHHGSKTSSSAEFLKSVGARRAILSVGYASRYGHPHQDVMNRYENANVDVVSTADSGSILLKINNNNWSLEEYRSVNPSVLDESKKAHLKGVFW